MSCYFSELNIYNVASCYFSDKTYISSDLFSMAIKMFPLLFITTFIVALDLHSMAAQTVVKGGYWLANAGFDISDINATFFTHLFCAFADLDNQTYEVTISSANRAYQFSTFTQIVKRKNPSVLTMLSIGGDVTRSATFIDMVGQDTSRKTFIDSSIKLARDNNFDGLDLVWEYPENATQMSGLGLLFNEWRAAVVNESKESGKSQLLLSAGVLYLSAYYSKENMYPIQAISNSLDWINLITFEFYGPTAGWSPNYTGPPAALYNPGKKESGDKGVQSWVNAGLSVKNLVLGFPFYGWSWRLMDSNNHGLFAPANGTGLGVGDGSVGFLQIKQFIAENNATKVFNDTFVTNYCYSGTTWIGYDDTESMSKKVEYAQEKGLLGYFAYNIGADDNGALANLASKTWKVGRKQSNMLVPILVTTIVVVLLLCTAATLCYIKRKPLCSKGIISRRKRPEPHNQDLDSSNLKAFNFNIIQEATNNFSSQNKLGEGGYGPVYKGVLPTGEQIAVKRLSKTSNQGVEEFQTEVSLTARLQHVNLVRVLGFCTEREEKMLIYEYMPNKSLDLYLNDPVRKHVLDWQKRVHIIEGVTQGLLYLQEYSNFTIIHRDIKSSNILLDKDMNPKISDFGMARLFGKDEPEANTSHIVGTYGCVPPEYVKKGIYSLKYDVYSFGVLLLQIISGKKHNRYYGTNEDLNILEYAYDLWREGVVEQFIDPFLDDSYSSCKLKTCLQVALLCVQNNAFDRPTMLEVSAMLKNESNATTATPKRPAFSKTQEEEDYLLKNKVHSVDNNTITQMLPR